MGQHTGVYLETNAPGIKNPASSLSPFHVTSPRGRDCFGAVFGLYEMAVVFDLIGLQRSNE
jgi:hypothetical protein